MADDDFNIGFDPAGTDQDQLLHPLSGWASMTGLQPQDIAQHIHDPEGFKDAMAAKNIPPPSMDLEHAGDGTFRPVSAWSATGLPPGVGAGGGQDVPPIPGQPPAPPQQPSPGVPGGQIPWGGGYPS